MTSCRKSHKASQVEVRPPRIPGYFLLRGTRTLTLPVVTLRSGPHVAVSSVVTVSDPLTPVKFNIVAGAIPGDQGSVLSSPQANSGILRISGFLSAEGGWV